MFVTIQDGGKISAEADVKLACKSVFALIFTSDEHPMLLEWLKPFKKMP